MSEHVAAEENAVEEISPAQLNLVEAPAAAQSISNGVLLIDVRSEAGRAGAGEIPGAVVVAKDGVDEVFGPEATQAPEALSSKDQEIVVFCGSENGSGPVVARLRELGYENAVHVLGGFPALKEAGVTTTEPVQA